MRNTYNWPKIIKGGIVIFLTLDLILALWVVYKRWFFTMPVSDYLILVSDQITIWTGRVLWIILLIWVIIMTLIRVRPRQMPSREQIIQGIIDFIPKLLRRLIISIPLLVILIILSPFLILQLKQKLPFIPPSSSVFISSEGKEIYVVDEKHSQIYLYNFEQVYSDQSYKQSQSIIVRGKPQRVMVAHKRSKIYVTDAGADKIIIIDQKSGKQEMVTVGKAPRYIAITPDERKAYVSNEQPIPQGTISVVDLASQKVTKTITGVNCPEGLAITPNGKWLYVASQCGGGQDPVFVLDIKSDKVITTIPGLAVGGALAIIPNGEKAYVVRGRFQNRDSSSGEVVSFPDQISVIRTTDNKVIKNIPISATALAVTPDSKYVLVGGNKQIKIIETKTDEIVNSISLATSPVGIAISKDERAYVWLPEENRLFLLGLSGLLQSKK